MRANVIMFWILAVFFGLAAAVYAVWTAVDWGYGASRIADAHVTPGPEWAGTVALALTTVLSAFIAFYLGRVHKAQGAELPEDRLDANIGVGAGTLRHPLLVVRGWNGGLPATLKLGGATLVRDVDYFPSPRASANELWITLDRDLSGAANRLEIVP